MAAGARSPAGGPVIGRPPKVTRADILAAVLQIGFADVTIPLVAERLGVTAPTVYRHVPDRATMLAAAWDLVVDEIDWPPLDGRWRDDLLAYAQVLWDALARFPGVVSALSTGLMPARTMDILLRLAVHLHRQGFAMDDAMLVIDTVIDTVIDHRLGIERLDGHTAEPSTSRDAMARSWRSAADQPPETRAALDAMRAAVEAPPAEWLAKKLALVLDGAALRRGPAEPA